MTWTPAPHLSWPLSSWGSNLQVLCLSGKHIRTKKGSKQKHVEMFKRLDRTAFLHLHVMGGWQLSLNQKLVLFHWHEKKKVCIQMYLCENNYRLRWALPLSSHKLCWRLMSNRETTWNPKFSLWRNFPLWQTLIVSIPGLLLFLFIFSSPQCILISSHPRTIPQTQSL